MSDLGHHHEVGNGVAWFIIGIVGLYLLSAGFGFPQRGTEIIVASEHHSTEGGHPSDKEHHDGDSHKEDTTNDSHSAENEAKDKEEHSDTEKKADSEEKEDNSPPVWTVIPFAALLLCIAVLPLIPATEHWWESNSHRFLVAGTLGLIVLAYYTFMHHAPLEGHWPAHHLLEPVSSGPQWTFTWAIFSSAILHEFIPFIVLLFSLYTISGGIRIEGDLQANPLTNATFIAVGGILASFIGTTGAAMLLIRPLLETNSERKHVKHTVVFFIFVVCNCGGCLLPIGDPPLFLGYLAKVPFLWTFMLWKEWLFVNGLLLLVYMMLDQFYYYPHETIEDIRRDITQQRRLTFNGILLNGILLAGVIAAVALLDPSKPFVGTSWHPWMYLREIVQIGLVALSVLLGSKEVRRANQFDFHAIIEVAALFSGIFICMQPALQILQSQGDKLGVDSPLKFFWYTGGLSSVLDNAPTYVVFFEAAKGASANAIAENASLAASTVGPTGILEHFLVAISVGAVFMGAMTYIGNGPNFMVKAIAEKSGVKMPSFFGYMAYSCIFLLPILLLMTWKYLS